MTDVVDLLRRSIGQFDRRVAEVSEDQWTDPTPCTEWSVRDLVNHLVGEDLWAPPLLAGQTLEEVGDRFDGDVVRERPKEAWAGARDGALAALDDGVLGRQVHTSMGQISAGEYLGQLFADHLIHAWDLARGIGADGRLDPDLVEQCDRLVRPQSALLQASGVYGQPVDVDDDADPQTQLLGLFGRRA